MAIKRVTINGPKLTKKQLDMIEKGKTKPIVYDEDLPEFSDEELAEFRRVSAGRRSERVKQNVTLRLKPATIRKAKALGKGYTGIMGRLLEMALDDPEMVRKAL